MGLFGSWGGSDNNKSSAKEETTYTDTSSFAASDSGNYEFSSDPMGSLGGTGSSVQDIIMEEQQKVLVQQAIAKITAIAWDKCSATKPDTALSSSEISCMQNVAASYLDTSVFIVKKMGGR